MNFYQISSNTGLVEGYEGTLSEAHAAAKSYSRDYVRIHLVDIPTDKDSILSLVNKRMPEGITILKTWRLSPRGAMVPLKDGEE
jgi:hypothetical protein